METANYREQYLLELIEKRKVKRTVSAIGWTMFVSELAITLISVIIGVILGFSGIDDDLLSNGVFNLALNVALTLIIFIAAPLLCCVALKIRPRSLMPLHKVSPSLFIGSVFVGFGFNSVSNMAASAFASFFSMFGISTGGSDITLEPGVLGFIISMLTIAVVPALIEEFAFRGFALGLLRKVMPDGAAIFVSAFLFGAMHGDLTQIPFAFCMGLVLAYTTILTNSVWPAIIIHFLNNGMSVVLDYTFRNSGPISSNIISFLYFLVSAVILIIGVLLMQGKIKEHHLVFSKNGTPAKRYFKWSLFNPGIILFIVVIIIGMLIS